jgi:hypothetical protein
MQYKTLSRAIMSKKNMKKIKTSESCFESDDFSDIDNSTRDNSTSDDNIKTSEKKMKSSGTKRTILLNKKKSTSKRMVRKTNENKTKKSASKSVSKKISKRDSESESENESDSENESESKSKSESESRSESKNESENEIESESEIKSENENENKSKSRSESKGNNMKNPMVKSKTIVRKDNINAKKGTCDNTINKQREEVPVASDDEKSEKKILIDPNENHIKIEVNDEKKIMSIMQKFDSETDEILDLKNYLLKTKPKVIKRINDEYYIGIFNNVSVLCQTKEGTTYINATKLCNDYDRKYTEWFNTCIDRRIIAKYECILKINWIEYYNSNSQHKGNYIHTCLAYDLYDWIINNNDEIRTVKMLSLKYFWGFHNNNAIDNHNIENENKYAISDTGENCVCISQNNVTIIVSKDDYYVSATQFCKSINFVYNEWLKKNHHKYTEFIKFVDQLLDSDVADNKKIPNKIRRVNKKITTNTLSHRHFSGSPNSNNKGFFIHPFLFLFMVNCVTLYDNSEINESIKSLMKSYYNENYYKNNKCILDEYKHNFKIFCLGLLRVQQDEIVDNYTIRTKTWSLRVEFYDDRLDGLDKLMKMYKKKDIENIENLNIFLLDKEDLSKEDEKGMLDFMSNSKPKISPKKFQYNTYFVKFL